MHGKAPSASQEMLTGVSMKVMAGSSLGQRQREVEEDRLPISALLARIRKLIPHQRHDHYEEIVRGFGIGTLRPPPSPMSDRELARAIAEFLKDAPSSRSVSTLRRRLDPSSGT
jgi:hypothetical protein